MSDEAAYSQDEFGDPHGLPWRVAPWGDGSSDTGNSNIISDRWQVVIASEMPTETAEFIVASVRFTTEAAAEIERLRAAIVTAKREALEEAAKVADRYLDSSDRSVLAAAKWIAEDIRALQEPKQ